MVARLQEALALHGPKPHIGQMVGQVLRSHYKPEEEAAVYVDTEKRLQQKFLNFALARAVVAEHIFNGYGGHRWQIVAHEPVDFNRDVPTSGRLKIIPFIDHAVLDSEWEPTTADGLNMRQVACADKFRRQAIGFYITRLTPAEVLAAPIVATPLTPGPSNPDLATISRIAVDDRNSPKLHVNPALVEDQTIFSYLVDEVIARARQTESPVPAAQ